MFQEDNREPIAETEKKKHSPGAWAMLILSCVLVLGLSIWLITILVRNSRANQPAETDPVQVETPAAPDTEAPETEAPETETPATEEPATEAPATEEPATEEPTTEVPTTEAPTEPLPEPTPDDVTGPADITGKAVKSGTVYIVGDSGYGGYWFGETQSARYCEAVSSVARALEGKADVYSLICPLAAGVNLSDETREAIGYSDEREAIRWMCDHMDPLVHNVPVWGALKSHNDEYLFFRTDHHWTSLGAYYAYREFCAVKGIRPHETEDFETYVYEGFIGSLYSYSNNNAALKSNPDTVTAYIPNGTNAMTCYMPTNGGYSEYNWEIVKDVSGYNRGSYYLTFVAGDQPFNYAHNETVTDGSSVLIVKDSYGNAFIPFLVDHYEHIYWIDYRSYGDWSVWAGKENSAISTLVLEKGIQDVILCNNISSTGSKSLLDTMEKIFK